MTLYIQMVHDQTVALMTGNQVLSIFYNLDNVLYTCRDYNQLAKIEVI